MAKWQILTHKIVPVAKKYMKYTHDMCKFCIFAHNFAKFHNLLAFFLVTFKNIMPHLNF